MRFVAGIALAAACVSTASAAPLSFYFSFDGSTYYSLGSSKDVPFSVLLNNPSAGQSFTTLVNSGQTAPGPSAGDGGGFSTNVTVTSGATGGLFYLAAIESGLPGTDASTFSASFSNSATSTARVAERLLVGQTVTPGGISVLAATLAPGASQALQTAALAFPDGYSIGQRYRFDFGTNAGTVTASIVEHTQNVAVTPEPCSLALLGTGLLGAVGVVRRRLM